MLTINERVKALEDEQREMANRIRSAAGHLVRLKPQQPGETTEQFAERLRAVIKTASGQLYAVGKSGYKEQ